jgi:hypothetical protein
LPGFMLIRKGERLQAGAFPCEGVGDDESYGARDGTGSGTILFALPYSHEGAVDNLAKIC